MEPTQAFEAAARFGATVKIWSQGIYAWESTDKRFESSGCCYSLVAHWLLSLRTDTQWDTFETKLADPEYRAEITDLLSVLHLGTIPRQVKAHQDFLRTRGLFEDSRKNFVMLLEEPRKVFLRKVAASLEGAQYGTLTFMVKPGLGHECGVHADADHFHFFDPNGGLVSFPSGASKFADWFVELVDQIDLYRKPPAFTTYHFTVGVRLPASHAAALAAAPPPI